MRNQLSIDRAILKFLTLAAPLHKLMKGHQPRSFSHNIVQDSKQAKSKSTAYPANLPNNHLSLFAWQLSTAFKLAFSELSYTITYFKKKLNR